MQKLLPKEFTVTDDVFEVFILKNNKIDGLENYNEGGLIIPCSYKDLSGACMSFEYVDSDDALCAGREIWGYPKKIGEIEFNVEGNKVSGSVSRKGKKIIDIAFEETGEEFNQPNLFPRLQVKRMPHVEHGSNIKSTKPEKVRIQILELLKTLLKQSGFVNLGK